MDPVSTGVVTAEAPAVVQPANTLENLDVNAATEIAAQADASAGADPTATPTPGEPEAAPATPVEGTVPAEADEAKMHRISQQNADYKRTLEALKIDPDSDTAEHLRTGMITLGDYVRSITPSEATATPASTPPAPEISLDQQIDNLQSILDKPIGPDGLAAENVKEQQKAFLDVIKGQAKKLDNIVRSQKETEQISQANSSTAAINEVFNKEVAPALPDGLTDEAKRTIATVFLAATDFANGELVDSHGKEKAQTPKGYAFSAAKIAPEFNAMIKALSGIGTPTPTPTPTPAIPSVHTPIAPAVLRPGTAGSTPPAISTEKPTLENMEARAKAYIASQQPQV